MSIMNYIKIIDILLFQDVLILQILYIYIYDLIWNNTLGSYSLSHTHPQESFKKISLEMSLCLLSSSSIKILFNDRGLASLATVGPISVSPLWYYCSFLVTCLWTRSFLERNSRSIISDLEDQLRYFGGGLFVWCGSPLHLCFKF